MDWLVDVFAIIWPTIKDNAVVAVVFTLFIIAVMMNYAAIVLLVNNKIMEKRKQRSMDRVDEVQQDIYQFVWSKYLTLAKEVLGEEYYDSMEARLVRYNINEAMERVKEEYRRRVRRNGFEHKSALEWSNYVDDCIKEDINIFTSSVDLNYHPSSNLKRPEWFKYNQEQVIPEVQHRLKHLFSSLLEIARNNKMKRFLIWRIQL